MIFKNHILEYFHAYKGLLNDPRGISPGANNPYMQVASAGCSIPIPMDAVLSQASFEWPQLQAQQIEPSCISCAIMCSSAQCSSSAAAAQPIELSLPLAQEKRNPTKAPFVSYSPSTELWQALS